MAHLASEPACLYRDGAARLLAFPRRAPARSRVPLLIAPSPITRWTVLSRRRGAGLLDSLADAGYRTYCLDWGEPVERDRDLRWSDLVSRLNHAIRYVARDAGESTVGLLGYSLGGTLACIAAARDPDSIAALVDIAGPIDFSHAGLFAWLADARWFDPRLPAAVLRASPPIVVRSLLTFHRATAPLRWLDAFGPVLEAVSPLSHEWLASWSQDHVPMPARAYTTYVRSLCQDNRLVRGEHTVGGLPVHLERIDCPVLAVAAKRDLVSPAPGTFALLASVGSADTARLEVPGGHVGSLVGRDAVRTAHAPIVAWLDDRIS